MKALKRFLARRRLDPKWRVAEFNAHHWNLPFAAAQARSEAFEMALADLLRRRTGGAR